ncbi:MAG: energy transducer TonB [Gemmatimonadaceae bacterium]
MTRAAVHAAVMAAAIAACGGGDRSPRVPPPRDPGPKPDEMPSLVNAELPFHYPASLYSRRVQGNVTLRIYIDRDGHVTADSTTVDETSGYPELDTAAIRGAPALRFVPAKAHGEPIAISILFPVHFRHPEARPLPGDSALHAATRGSDAS